MSRMRRMTAVAAAALALSACSLGSLLGGGGDVPSSLLTLTPSAAEPATVARTASAGEAVTIRAPVIPESLRTVRVPVQIGPTAIAYVKDLHWVDTPDELFQDLLAETVTRMTSRVVLSPDQPALDPGLTVTGQLRRMGYDAQLGAVIVEYDANLSTAGGTRVETRRFESTVPADGTAATVGPALNQAANQVAMEFAQWIAG
jgi:cholesterol transport system auxiliary component